MRGTLLVFQPGRLAPQVIELDHQPQLDELKRCLDGGHLELVPGFRSITHYNVVMDCVAFSDEDGKRKRLEVNNIATVLWDVALRRNGTGLLRPDGRAIDWLVGPIIVLFGDRELMAEL